MPPDKEKENFKRDLGTVVAKFYGTFLSSDKSAPYEKIKEVIDGALKLKELDESAYYTVLAVGITELATRIRPRLGKEARGLVERVVKYCIQRSEYLREQEQNDG